MQGRSKLRVLAENLPFTSQGGYRGRHIENDPRSGRPSTSRTETNIAAVRRLTNDDQHNTIATVDNGYIGMIEGYT